MWSRGSRTRAWERTLTFFFLSYGRRPPPPSNLGRPAPPALPTHPHPRVDRRPAPMVPPARPRSRGANPGPGAGPGAGEWSRGRGAAAGPEHGALGPRSASRPPSPMGARPSTTQPWTPPPLCAHAHAPNRGRRPAARPSTQPQPGGPGPGGARPRPGPARNRNPETGLLPPPALYAPSGHHTKFSSIPFRPPGRPRPGTPPP